MFVELIEDAAKYLVFDDIRDESLGDLWEADYRLKIQGTPKTIRLVKAIWNFLLIVKASLIIFFEEKFGYLPQEADDSHSSRKNTYVDITNGTYLNSENVEQIRAYCHTRNLYNSFLTRRLLKSSIDPNSYWIRQSERIIEKCKARREKIDCEAIVNSFMLSSLVRRVESFPPENVDIRLLYDLVKKTNLTDEFIDKYVLFDNKMYRRQLIFRTWSLAVYVISWKPGQVSWAHHHGYALDVIKVLHGEMTHWHIASEKLENDIPFECFRHLKSFYEGPSETFSVGAAIAVDRGQGHQIGNFSDGDLVTLHFRFGHPPEDDHWRSTNDTEMFVWNQTEGCFDIIRLDRGMVGARR